MGQPRAAAVPGRAQRQRGPAAAAAAAAAAAVLLPVAKASFYEPNQEFYPFPDLDCTLYKDNVQNTIDPTKLATFNACDCDSPLKGAVVDIEDGFQKGRDKLICEKCQQLGFEADWKGDLGLLFIRVPGGASKTIREVAEVLQSVHFITSDTSGTAREITYNYGHGFYSSHTGHFYEYYADSGIQWFAAQEKCSADDHKLLGQTGYLITITSEVEQQVAESKLGGQGWMGSSDAGKEDTWRWVAGPEGCPGNTATGGLCDFGSPAKGTYPAGKPNAGKAGGQATGTGPEKDSGQHFFTDGSRDPQPVDPVSGDTMFAHWSRGEPNNWKRNCPGSCADQGEDFGHFLNSGYWNDYPQDHPGIDGYICEWGGVGDLCLSPTDAADTVVVQAGCGTFTSQQTCDGALGGKCMWDDTKTPKCQLDGCARWDDEKSCNHDPACHWGVDANGAEVCSTKYCAARYGDEAKCNSDPMCHWDTVNIYPVPVPTTSDPNPALTMKMCQEFHCTSIGDRCECAAHKQCNWDQASASCIGATYSGCPGADVVFVMDASGSMQAKFGSHSNGYYGMIEQIRDWAKDAPLTKEPSSVQQNSEKSSGFRVGFISFGRPDNNGMTTALYAPSKDWPCTQDPCGCTPGQDPWCTIPLDCQGPPGGMGGFKDPDKAGCSPGQPGGYGANIWYDPYGTPVYDNGFLKNNGKYKAPKKWRPDFPIKGTTGETPGHITGQKGEIDRDLDWHEEYFYGKWSNYRTILIPGLQVAEQWFREDATPKSSKRKRKHILFVLTDGALHDKDADVLAIEDRLKTDLEVETFGVVMRKGQGQSSASRAAEKKLKPLTSDPHDTHFLNLPLENLKSDILDKLCDPNSPFGAEFTKGGDMGGHCELLKTTDKCNQDSMCKWSDASMKCERSVCVPECNQAGCDGHGGLCKWDPATQLCTRNPSCDSLSQATCGNQKCCQWTGSKCEEDYCCVHDTEQNCAAFVFSPRPSCMPAFTGTNPDPCPGDPAAPIDCGQSANKCAGCCDVVSPCFWNTGVAPATCTKLPCLNLWDQAKCSANPDCQWQTNVEPHVCANRPCNYKTQGECNADPQGLCVWDVTKTPMCQLKYCAKYTNEMDCNHDPICRMDCNVQPCACKRTSCGEKESEAACQADPDCRWSATSDKTDAGGAKLPTTAAYAGAPAHCKQHTCSYYSTPDPFKSATEAACKCNADPKCVWHTDHCSETQFNACPDLDVLMVLDGSGSMRRTFGHHPHGFYALMEMLRDWMTHLPLTKTKAGEPVPTQSGQFRVGFLQFSRPGTSGIRQCKAADCTRGRLSGSEAELQKDIDYHEANFISGTTVLEPALVEAKNVFADPTVGNRKKVMIVICDGQLKDRPITNLDQPIADLTNGGNAGGAGGGLGVTIFGVVMRRFQQHSQEDEDAERLLKPIVSLPQDDHFVNLPLDDIPAQLLGSFCDPNSKLGKAIAVVQSTVELDPSCSVWGFADECNVNPQCEWQQPALRQEDCPAPDMCPALGCQRVPPQHKPPWDCMTCRPQRSLIECGMQHVPSATLSAHCGKSSCAKHCDAAACNADPKCTFVGNTCVRKVCQHADSTACVSDPDALCQWTQAGKCEKKPCGATFVKAQCEAKTADNCMWDTGKNPPVCRAVVDCPDIKSQDQCLKNPSCAWDTCNANLGQATPCADLGSKDLCDKVPGCTYSFDIPNERYMCSGTPASDCATKFPNAQPAGSGQCRYKKCIYTNPTDCVGDPACLWDVTLDPVGCRENKCYPYGTDTNCKTDSICRWVGAGVPPYCTEGCGAQTTQATCSAYGGCAWDDAQTPKCYIPYCVKQGANEALCNHDPRCHWNIALTPPSCDFNSCMRAYAQHPVPADGPTALAGGNAACDAAPECAAGSDAKGAYCKPQTCGDHKNKCDCEKADGCVWSGDTCMTASFSQCPDLDVVFIIDGSGSMAAPFGHHPHGFMAMMEMLRDWVKTVPLTGEDKNTGKTSAVKGGSLRLSFIQFSGANRRTGYYQTPGGPNVVPPSLKPGPCTGCSDGRLTGKLAELDKDLDWHEDNYIKKGTMLYESMHHALEIFQQDSPAHRNHVLVIVTDGELFDPQKLPPVRQSLDAVDVQTFGVVVRKGKAHTPADLKAQQTLKPVTSDPHDDHFINVPMDEVPDKLLNDFCDPNSVFGRQIQQRFGAPPAPGVVCGKLGTFECLKEPKCDHHDFTGPAACSDGTCPNLNCYARPADLKARFTCPECTLAAGSYACMAGTAAPAAAGICNATRCTCYQDQGTCEQDSGCEWKGNPATCVRKICVGLDQGPCVAGSNSQVCIWDTKATPAACAVKPCLYPNRATCNGDLKCFWDDTKTPPTCVEKKDCTQHNTPEGKDGLVPRGSTGWGTCINDPSGVCLVDTFCPASKVADCADTTPTCRKTWCDYDNQAACKADSRCLWDSTLLRGQAATAQTGAMLCMERVCPRYDSEADCLLDKKCIWDATKDPKCFEDECAQIAGEAQCNQNRHCKFDVTVTPAGCVTRYCWGQYGTNQAGCGSDPKCMFDGTLGPSPGECTEKVCSTKYATTNYGNDKLAAACACRRDPDCDWDGALNLGQGGCVDKNVGGCPPLDLTIIVDGSGSMTQSFAPHPSGYFALLEVLRDWIRTLPLTGTARGVIPSAGQQGFRVALIQFSGETNPGVVKLDPTTKGELTGDLTELDGALDWHEANPIFRGTYIQRALEQAVETFRTSPPNRKDVLLIFTDGALQDPDALLPAEAALDAEGVKSFGIVVRRFPQKVQVDTDAERTLKQVVSDPKETHVLNLQVDDIAGSALKSFCSQTGPFGAFIVGGLAQDQLRSCGQMAGQAVCNANALCEWDLIKVACVDHRCRMICNDKECADDPQCRWQQGPQECGKIACSTHTDSAACTAGPPVGCTWDVTKSPPCTPLQGCAKYTPQGATPCNGATDASCMWLGSYTIGGASGDEPPFKDHKCSEIQSFTGSCDCTTQIKGAFVEVEDNYNPATDRLACGAPCAALGISEAWDGRTGFLYLESATGGTKSIDEFGQALAATKFTTSSKDGRPRKVTRNYGQGFFSSVTGHYYRYYPHLKSEQTVFWQDAQDRCSSPDNKLLGLTGYLATITSKPEQDVAAAKLGGQGWMGGSDAWKEGEWRWVTGPEGCPPKPGCDIQYDSKTGKPTGTDVGKGLHYWDGKGAQGRTITFAHWDRGEPNDYRGKCSGSCDTIGEDFAHFLGGGDWNDYPPDHTSIRGYICEWGGIGELCMSAKDAHASVLMGATVGQCVEKCSSWRTRADCSGAGCRWDGSACLDADSCTPLAPADCHATPTCFYDATVDPARCTPVYPECKKIKSQQVCDNYPLCEKPLPPDTTPACAASPELQCQWTTTDVGCPPDVCGVCAVRPCTYSAQGDCDKDTKCQWVAPPDVVVAKCVVKQGCPDQPDAPTCADYKPFGMGGATPCVWDVSKTPKCDLNKCAKLRDEAACGTDGDCMWDTARKPAICSPTPCYPHGSNKAACTQDPSGMCGFDTKQNKCVVKHCGLYTTRCDCIADAKCSWDGVRKQCVAGAFVGCPPLDLVVLFDGSGSMIKPFVDNHPQGYPAMLEMFRRWIRTLPLTGEAAGAASSSSDRAFRIGMIQFSKEAEIAVDPTTKGRLSGDLAEIDSMITWHEANHMARFTYIAKGLDQAVETFRDSPVSRKKVLLIVSDGKIKDTDQLAKAEAELVAEGVTTFGVVIRQATAKTQVDLDAFESLKQIVSEPRDLHALDLTMDEVGTGVLASFCDASGPFGRYIADSSASAACAAQGQSGCEADPKCNWNAYAQRCGDHPCAMHCTEAQCKGDAANACQWGGSSCTRGPCCEDPLHGTCASGCCDCVTGWDTCNAKGSTANCHLYADGGSCSWCNARITCSGHGTCLAAASPGAASMCDCFSSWSGADCSIPSCSPAGPRASTAYPNTPVAGEPFQVIVHGCGVGPSDRLKLVRVPESCAKDMSGVECSCAGAAAAACTWPQPASPAEITLRVLRDGVLSPDGEVLRDDPASGLMRGMTVTSIEGQPVRQQPSYHIDLAALKSNLPAKLAVSSTLVRLSGDCAAAAMTQNPRLEPNRTSEISFRAYADKWDGDDATGYMVCWQGAGEPADKWTKVQATGGGGDGGGGGGAQRVCKTREGCDAAGSNVRGAAAGTGGQEWECECQGLRAGDDGCLHWSWFLLIFLGTIAALVFAVYKLRQKHQERKTLQEAKYEDLSMEAMAKENMREQLVDKSVSKREQEERADV